MVLEGSMYWFNQAGTLDQYLSCSWLSLAGCQQAAMVPRASGTKPQGSRGDTKEEEEEEGVTFLVTPRRRRGSSHMAFSLCQGGLSLPLGQPHLTALLSCRCQESESDHMLTSKQQRGHGIVTTPIDQL